MLTPGTISRRRSLTATGSWKKLGARLVVGHVEDSIRRGTARDETGPKASRNRLQSITLLETIEQGTI